MEPAKSDEKIDPSTLLAIERTLLAWIRTGLSLMGFGFVVARFGLFLREIASSKLASGMTMPHSPHASLFIGVFLLLIGTGVNLYAGLRFRHYRHSDMTVLKGSFLSSAVGTAVAFTISVLGLAMAVYLFAVDRWQ